MQTIARTLGGRRQHRPPLCESGRSAAAATLRDASAVGIETLANRFGQALPTLENTATSYSHEVHSELLYDLCASLVRCAMGRPSHWTLSSGSGNQFVHNAIRASITDERLALLQRNIEYHLQIADVIEQYGYDRALESSELAVLVTSGNCGYLEIGEALDALEREEEGLGAAFYWQFTASLNRVLRLYNHDDAFLHEERLRECAEQEDEDNREQYEFPEVEEGLPECIRKTSNEATADTD